MKTALHVLLGLIQLALVLPFLVPALWFVYTGEAIWAFTDSDWSLAALGAFLAATAISLIHLFVEDLAL